MYFQNRFVILISLFLLLVHEQSFSQKKQLIDSLLVQSNHATEDTIKVNLLNEISSNYKCIDKLKSIEFATQAYHLSEKIDYNRGLINSSLLLGSGYNRLGEPVISKDFYFKAVDISRKINDQFMLAKTYNRLISYYGSIQDFNHASEYAFKAREIFEKTGHKHEISGVYINIAYVYAQQGNYKKAKAYNFKALNIANELNDFSLLALIYNNLGAVYSNIQNLDTSNIYLEIARDYYYSAEDYEGMCYIYYNIGDNFLKSGNEHEAYSNYHKGVQLSKSVNSQELIITGYQVLANYHYDVSNYDSAEYYAKNGMALSLKLNNVHKRSKFSLILYNVLAYKEDYKKALEYLLIHKQISDSVNRKDNMLEISKLEAKYELKKKEKDLALEKQARRNAGLIHLLLTISVLFISGIIIFTLIRKRSKDRYDKLLSELKLKDRENEIARKDKELFLVAKNIKDKNQMLEILKSEFEQFLKRDNLQKHIDKQEQLRNMKILNEEDWLRFKELFASIHFDFSENLMAQYPELSEGDKRQLMLLKLGYSINQSVEILGIGYSAVKKARQRLAKKMGLDSADLLYELVLNTKE